MALPVGAGRQPDPHTSVWTFENYKGAGFGRGAVLCADDRIVRVWLPKHGAPTYPDDLLLDRLRIDQVLKGGGMAAEAAALFQKLFLEGAHLDSLKVSYDGFPPFTSAVLRTCRSIPHGHTMSYRQLAKEAGSPLATRAVGNVMARNPVPLVVPCHRVIRSHGDLGNYGGGIEMKRWLLEREGFRLDPPPSA